MGWKTGPHHNLGSNFYKICDGLTILYRPHHTRRFKETSQGYVSTNKCVIGYLCRFSKVPIPTPSENMMFIRGYKIVFQACNYLEVLYTNDNLQAALSGILDEFLGSTVDGLVDQKQSPNILLYISMMCG